MTAPPPRWSEVELLALDVDGVLTDGRILLDADGREIKVFHAHDGYGIHVAVHANLPVALVTARASKAVSVRAEELGIPYCYQNAKDKVAALEDISRRSGIPADRICYVGDDTHDLPALRWAGIRVAVPNARPEVRAEVHYVTNAPGGWGAAREVVEHILAARATRTKD